jgi:hypothetical protein
MNSQSAPSPYQAQYRELKALANKIGVRLSGGQLWLIIGVTRGLTQPCHPSTEVGTWLLSFMQTLAAHPDQSLQVAKLAQERWTRGPSKPHGL